MPLPASRSLQGKTCYLYYLLVQRLIDARPTVFQDTRGDVFVIEDTVQYWDAMIICPGHDILTLVDAGGTLCVPSDYILNSGNLRIVLTSSPRPRHDRKWLKQYYPYTGRTLVMAPWIREELLLSAHVYPTHTTSSTDL